MVDGPVGKVPVAFTTLVFAMLPDEEVGKVERLPKETVGAAVEDARVSETVPLLFKLKDDAIGVEPLRDRVLITKEEAPSVETMLVNVEVMTVSEALLLEAVLEDCAVVELEPTVALVAISLELEPPFELEATVATTGLDAELLVSRTGRTGLSVVVRYSASELEVTDELLSAGELKRELAVERPSADGALDEATVDSADDPAVEAGKRVVSVMVLAADEEPPYEVDATDDDVQLVSEAGLSTGIMECVTTTVVDAAEVNSINDVVHDVSEAVLRKGITEVVTTAVVDVSEADCIDDAVEDVSRASLSTGITEAVITSVVVMSDDAELAASLALKGKNEENAL